MIRVLPSNSRRNQCDLVGPVTMDSEAWKKAMVEMLRARQASCAADPQDLFPFRLPRVAASEEAVREVERHLGHALDPQYRAFLRHAAGWPAFFQAIDLFGPEELLGGGRFDRAVELLTILEDEGTLRLEKLTQSMLLPIAVSEDDSDLFVIAKPSSPIPGTVLWYANYEIERHRDFDHFFMSMIEHEKLRLKRLRLE